MGLKPYQLDEIYKTRVAINNVYLAKQEWEDGLITDVKMIHKVDEAMIKYLITKGIIHK